MLMTEEEAKTKTCPLVRYCENSYHVSADNGHPMYAHQRCEGSACMAWRWGLFGDDGTGTNGPKDYTSPRKCVWAPIPLKGYCGAFGKVEGIA